MVKANNYPIFLWFIATVILLGSTSSNATQIIKHVSSISDRDQQKTYYLALLQLAIDKSEEKFGPASLQEFGTTMVYQRRLKSLNSGELDVMWAMTTEQREQQALAIKIPIFKGLIGYRIMVIQDIKQPAFAQIKNTEQLKGLIALQGLDWSDTHILRANNFTVQTSDWYESLYRAMSEGFYDYFPRGVLEPWAEMRQHHYDNLLVESNHLLYYPAAMYYFVQKENQALAQRLEYGLNQAIDDGSFDRLLYNYPAHKEAFAKARLNRRVLHKLENPFLPKTAPLADQRLWYQLTP